MHLPTHAGPRRRTRRALLVAVLAAAALPAAAQAAVVEEAADGTLRYRAASGESNNLSVRSSGPGIEISDLTGLTSRTPLCAQVSTIRVSCAIGVRLSEARLGDRSDGFAISVSSPLVVDGGTGNDAYTAGGSPIGTRVVFRGGDGQDLVHYPRADRGVGLTNQGIANDGRPGLDGDNILTDVEQLQGSPFSDDITAMGTTCCNEVSGGRGNDILRDGLGGPNSTSFDMGRIADGADRIIGIAGSSSMIDYSERTRPVNVTLNFDGADDGEPGEGDEIVGSHEFVFAGEAGDVIRAPAGSLAEHFLFGGAGDDRLEGAEGPDELVAGPGVDTVLANGGNDRVHAGDLFRDIVGCGTGQDAAVLDSDDVRSSCETVGVGVLRLTPKTVTAKAGEPTELRLSWRHPASWRKLRKVELRLTQAGASVGAITVRPRAGRITADGAVTLLRKRTRLGRKGKTVTARLSLRLDKSLAGQTLKAEVEATDTRGRRQLERDAGTIRVAR